MITQDLAAAIEAETGRNLYWGASSTEWVYRPGHPTSRCRGVTTTTTSLGDGDRETDPADNRRRLPIFRMPVDYRDFRKGRTKPQSFRVDIMEALSTRCLPGVAEAGPLPFRPLRRGHVSEEVDFENSVWELRLQLRDDDDVGGRQFAAAQLGKKGGLEAGAQTETAR